MDEFTTKFVGNMYNQMTSDDSNVNPKGPLPKNKAIKIQLTLYKFSPL